MQNYTSDPSNNHLEFKMQPQKLYDDPQRYVEYYTTQAGNGLPGYHGSSAMYGAGLGGLFRGLFRMAIPLLKRGFSIAKPHLKSAARNIVGDVVNSVMSRQTKQQDGSGLMVMSRGVRKRPPGRRSLPKSKKRKNETKTRAKVKRGHTPRRTLKGNTTKLIKNLF